MKSLCFLMVLAVVYVQCKPAIEKTFPKVDDNGYLFQGDMVMSKEQIEVALDGGDVDGNEEGNRNQFGVNNSKRFKWPNAVVPYDISGIGILNVRVFDDENYNGIDYFYENERKIFVNKFVKVNKALNKIGLMGATENAARKAMAAWESKTCVRFVERTNEKNYLKFVDDGYGKCFSYVGMIMVGAQKLSLGFECFYKGIAIHEIGHALGLHHEQSRPDRDDYAEILWDNIKEAAKPQFKKYSHNRINSLGSPYDYDSIMHYRSVAFAKYPFTKTIRAKKPGVSFGQRSYISEQDAIQINKYYNCKM